MPFEDRKPQGVRVDSHPVHERAGLLFTYLGPKASISVLPDWDILTRFGGHYSIQLQDDLTCNWLQIQENAADVTHTAFLHAYRFRKLGLVDTSGFGAP
jgi:5,5'-dehydrodivanillate O-demethylase